MIGLGSNRLTVCRRGGMSVTQAGRGGMEWLAGGRMPSWASPYSAQATAALLAQFPTQWPTIRDYGFAHPEIVGYMNAYAPEDAKIAYSLVEGIGTRWLDMSDGNSWIQTTTPLGGLECVSARTNVLKINGSWFGSVDRSYCLQWTDLNLYVGAKNSEQNLGAYTVKDDAVVQWTKHTVLIDYTVYNHNKDYSADTSALMINRDPRYYISKNKYAWVKADNVIWLVPFIRNNVNGMIDVLSGTFYQNAGSGSFTIYETPAS